MDSKKIPELDANGLRKFAFTSTALLIVLFALLIPWLFGFNFPKWPWIIGGVLAAWGGVAPTTLRPVYQGWMRFGLFMNRITTPIILGLVFFLVFTPVALIMRLIGRDPLHAKIDKSASSYRTPSIIPPKDKMEKPF